MVDDRHSDRRERGRLIREKWGGQGLQFYRRTSGSPRVLNLNPDFQVVPEKDGMLLFSSLVPGL